MTRKKFHSQKSRPAGPQAHPEHWVRLPKNSESQGARFRIWLLPALFLILAPCLAYSPLKNAGFIWDDDQYVTENQTLRTADGLRRIWFEPRSVPQYYPLVHTTYWMEYRLWGLNPTGYHLVNVLLHGLSCILLWWLLKKLQVPGAWLASAIFAVHPVMVESVAWITERKNVLSLPLALASMHCLLNAEWLCAFQESRRKKWGLYLLALLLFIAALLSKTVVCTMPAVVMVIAWWKTGEIDRKLVVRLLPFFIIGIALGLVTVWLEKHHVGAQGAEWSLSMLDRVLLAGRNLWFYFGKLLWPDPLIFFYPRWSIDSSQVWQYSFPVLFVLVLFVLWIAQRIIGRGPLAAVLIFSGVMFPALGFFDVYPFRYSFVADHFQYHASIALIVLTTSALFWSDQQLGHRLFDVSKYLAGAILLVLAVLTYRQSHAYSGLESIFLDTVKKNPTAWGASTNLVKMYLNAGRVDEAFQLAQQSVEFSPHIPDTHNALGGALVRLGLQEKVDIPRLEEAVRCFQETIRIQPNYNEAYFNLASILAALGRHHEAADYFQKLLALAPYDVDAALGLGQSYTHLGKLDEAANLYRKVLEAEPKHLVALHRLGVTSAMAGKLDDAISYFQLALRMNPRLPEVRNDLASAYVAKHDFQSARFQYESIVQEQPTNAITRNNLGVVLMQLGETRLAIEQFEQATQLAPDYTEATTNLQRARDSLNTP